MVKWNFHSRISGGAEPSVPTTVWRHWSERARERERDRDRERQTDRETERQTDRQTDGRTNRQRGREGGRREGGREGGSHTPGPRVAPLEGRGLAPAELRCSLRFDLPGGVGRLWRHSGQDGEDSLPFSQYFRMQPKWYL